MNVSPENINSAEAILHYLRQSPKDALKRSAADLIESLQAKASPQATVEPLTDEQIKDVLRQLAQDALDAGWKNALNERAFPNDQDFVNGLVDEAARALLATHQTSPSPYEVLQDQAQELLAENRQLTERLAASKADTGEAHERYSLGYRSGWKDALETAAHRWGVACGFDKHGVSAFIRDMKGTLSTIKAEPTGEQS